jgi:hypothetical protein
MHPLAFKLLNLLAEADAPAQRNQLSLSDLKKGFRDRLNGDTNDGHYSYYLWLIVAGVLLLGLILHSRQRKQTGEAPSSPRSLFREIARDVPFPFGTRLLLQWVAHCNKVPAATLLISENAFQKSVAEWSAQPTFGPIRHWGASRLDHLHAILFQSPRA